MRRSRKIITYLVVAVAVFFLLIVTNRWYRQSITVHARQISPTIDEYAIPPEVTDHAIDDWLESHYVAVDKSVASNGHLFLFFSGTYGHPGRQRLITQQAATLGYHAINLRYPNSATVAQLCRNSEDPDCHEKVRLEILYGSDLSDQVNISRANSIENRLVKLLLHLHQKQPKEGWLEYLDGNVPKWSTITVAGHSQGSGHAAMIAHQHQVARVVMFGGPADYSRVLQAFAPWLGKSSATSADRYYGFIHGRDRGFRRILRAWELMGMSQSGKIVNVDVQLPPYNYAQQLVTSAIPARPGKYHGSVVTDHTTPMKRDGKPSFLDVWKYLCDISADYKM